MRTRSAAILAAALLATSCSGVGQERTIVATVYPLAFAAERIAGPGWVVLDLTASGADAHDIELSLDQRAALQDADVVVYVGNIGFQPQVEEAVAEADGDVIAIEGPRAAEDGPDPHFWLSPRWFLTRIAHHIQRSFREIDPGRADEYVARFRVLSREIEAIDHGYEEGLRSCRFRTMIVSHEAFGFLSAYGLEQFGLAGLEPEGGPTSDAIEGARRLIAEGEAGAIFYEPTAESRRIAENVANDAGVPALPLSPIESQPPDGDYLSALEHNLASLRRGLECR